MTTRPNITTNLKVDRGQSRSWYTSAAETINDSPNSSREMNSTIYRTIVVAALACISLSGQIFRVDPAPVMTTAGNVNSGGYPALYAVNGASVKLCGDAACATAATAYANATNTQCPINAPVTLPGTSICSSTTGPQGQFGFWLATGTYWYQIGLPNGTKLGPYPVTPNLQIAGVSEVLAGAGIQVSNPTGILTVTNIGVTSFNGRTGSVTLQQSDWPAGGATGDVQINVAGAFTGSSAVTWSGGVFTVAGQMVTAANNYAGFTSVTDGALLAGFTTVQNGAGTAGGYFHLAPITYNPYDGSPCTDVYGNPVNQPVMLPGDTVGSNDAFMWVSLSPTMPGSGSCGAALPVNETYGLNLNMYFLARGGLATDNPAWNAIQVLPLYGTGANAIGGGGVAASSLVAYNYVYPGGYTTALAAGPPLTHGDSFHPGELSYSSAAGCLAIYNGSGWVCFSGGGAGGAAGPLYAVQSSNPAGTLYGDSGLLYNPGVALTITGGNMVASGTSVGFDATTCNLTTCIQAPSGGVSGKWLIATDSVFWIAESAPPLSGSGQAKIYFDSTANSLKVSQNGGAFVNLVGGGSGTPGGSSNSIQTNESGAFYGDSVFVYNPATPVVELTGGSFETVGASAGFNASTCTAANCIQAPSGGVYGKWSTVSDSTFWLEESAPAAPSSGQAKIYADSTLHQLLVSEAGYGSSFVPVATTSGTLTNGDCVSINATGNLIDAGGACSTGGGGGTVSSSTVGTVAYYTGATTVAGSTAFEFNASTVALTLTGTNAVFVAAGTNGGFDATTSTSYQAFQAPSGGALFGLGVTVGQALYPKQASSCSSLNTPGSGYGGWGFASGSTYCYYDVTGSAWKPINLATAGSGGYWSTSGSDIYNSTGTNVLVGTSTDDSSGAVLQTHGYISALSGFSSQNSLYNTVNIPNGGVLTKTLSVVGTSSASSVLIDDGTSPGGIYFTTNGASNGTMSVGSNYVGLNWTAQAAAATSITQSGASILFFSDTGLTSGNAFTPTLMAKMASGALLVNSTGSNDGTGALIQTSGFVSAQTGFYSVSSSTNALNLASGGAQAALGFTSPDVSYNAFQATGGGMAGKSFTAINYVQTGNYYGTLASGPPLTTSDSFHAGALAYSIAGGCFAGYNGSTWACIGSGGASGVSSVSGTANEIFANGTYGSPQTGAVTFTLPQSIGTSSNVQFGNIGSSGAVTVSGTIGSVSTITGSEHLGSNSGTGLTFANSNGNFEVNGNGAVTAQGAVASSIGFNVTTDTAYNSFQTIGGFYASGTSTTGYVFTVGGDGIITNTAGVQGTGFFVTGGYTGQTWTITFSGGFTGVAGCSSTLFFKGGILVACS